MLPFFMAGVVGLYFLSLRRWSLLRGFLPGLFLGLAPLFFYDMVNFGNPLALPNIAGNFSDTLFNPTWKNFTAKIGFYANMVTLYVPILWLGLAGLVLLPRAFRREQIAIFAMIAVLVGYVLNIDTTGDCQFGPRYLLPALPFLSLGLIGFAPCPGPIRIPAILVILAVGLFSVAVNLSGALYGAMYCDLKRYAFTTYLAQFMQGQFRTFPLAVYLALPFALALLWFLIVMVRRPRSAGPELTAAPVQP
jgi:hypothetical protein